MKRASAAFGIALAVFIVLTVIGSLFVTNPYLFMRLNPDGTVNTTFLALEDLNCDSWYSTTYISYEQGVKHSTCTLRRGMREYHMIKTDASEETQCYILKANVHNGTNETGSYIGCSDLLQKNLGMVRGDRYTQATNRYDLAGNCTEVIVKTQGALGTAKDALIHILTFEYHADGTMAKQTRTLEDGTYTYQLYNYTDGALTKIEQYDQAGTLLGYSEYTHSDRTQECVDYTANGTKTSSSTLRYNLFRQPSKLETYDSDGNITSKLTYNYSILQIFLTSYGACYFIIILCFSLFIGIEFTENMKKGKKKNNQ